MTDTVKIGRCAAIISLREINCEIAEVGNNLLCQGQCYKVDQVQVSHEEEIRTIVHTFDV